MTLLDCRGVTKRFGGLVAVRDVSFAVGLGEIVALIGPNGAGKTTLFNCISGVYRLTAGTLRFDGRDLAALRRDRICRAGVGRTFQIPRPFLDLSALENVLLGAVFGKGGASLPHARAAAQEDLAFVGLDAKAEAPARSLTFQERRALEVARALATRPKLLLLDEVMAGLNPTEVAGLVRLVRRIRDERGVTVLWVEHVMRAVMDLAERIVVLHQGSVVADGPPPAVVRDPAVVEAYLGEKYVF